MLAPNAKLRSEIVPGGPVSVNDAADELNDTPSLGFSPYELGAATQTGIRYRHRTLPPHCCGTFMIVAAILESVVITKILAHLGLPTRAPPRAPARSFNLYDTA